ncbi:MAG: dicarboxylate/amino acid:cation symporter [Flavobacteriaceae bacterium]|nr:dicarboxylate/amino acid:cation symporter [Flavobacteriaceae bacterium]|tara:strand:+ start:211 stop:1479 length:1269 start_codon:yes stop_codon:yes gene_type:complete
MSLKNLQLHWKIILGMFLGVLFGFLMSNFDQTGKDIISDWIKPFGTIFINALKLIAIPLILASLIKGISDLKDISKLSKMGGITIATYLITTVIAVSVGLAIVNVVKPGNSISDQTRIELLNAYEGDADKKREAAAETKNSGPLQPIIDIVPSNIISAATDNKNMLQIIFFSILFGISMILIPEKKSKPLKDFFDSLNEVILKIIDLIMSFAPYGVFALLATLIVEAPKWDLLKSLLLYSITLIIGLFSLIIIYTIAVRLILNKSPNFFFKGILPAQLVAFSTSSSAATLPVTMDRVHNNLKVKKEVSSFVLPIGATINMDGTAVYQAIAAVFIAQTFGLDLSITAQLGIIVTATLASIGAAAVPSAGIIVLVIVLAQAGIPEAGLALIFAVDRPLDMCRTVVNITGDATVSMIVDKIVSKK